MTENASDVAELFSLLESNKLKDVDEIKKVFHDHFLSTKDNWLVNGLFDYYLNTNSLRAIEVLVGVREPHDKYLLDRLSDLLAKSDKHEHRIRTLIFLGHVARRQPIWLHKLASHSLFRELLKLLKMEKNTLSLMSALLLLVTLLPMLPATLGPFLNEIFEVFNRLANLHCDQSSLLASSSSNFSASSLISAPMTLEKDRLYLLHLQVALYSLFHRLYAMYPCNFISYLKQQYSHKNHMSTFTHTVRPMLDSVRMHPLLITMSKDTEVAPERWKKIQHHDIVAECGRFALDKNRREEVAAPYPPTRYFTPIPDNNFFQNVVDASLNEEDETFWSPSMLVPPNSPPNAAHDARSTPSTPNNRSRSSPPEPAIEATPQTTPVKDLRANQRQVPMSSSAVRALSAFGNGVLGVNSRPTTPIPTQYAGSGDVVSQKIGKIMADRQNITLRQAQAKIAILVDEENYLEVDNIAQQNGRNSSCLEDQEISAIVNAQNTGRKAQEKMEVQSENFSKQIKRLRFLRHPRTGACLFSKTRRRTKSCSDAEMLESDKINGFPAAKKPEIATQTINLLLYEDLLVDVLEQNCKGNESDQKVSRPSSDGRMSPSAFLDRYIESCVRANGASDGVHKSKHKQRQSKHRKGTEDGEGNEDNQDEDDSEANCANQQLQLMLMQLQFERQRREVHAERNRRLLGKLRDCRALEEHNNALTNRLKIMEKDMENFKMELECKKKEAQSAEERHAEALRHWQAKCVEEQLLNKKQKDRMQSLEADFTSEQKKLTECMRQKHEADAALFEAAHKLKCAMKAASHSEELKKVLESVQKKFLLLGEARMKLQEHSSGPVHAARQETAQIQRSYTEELSNLRRQLESRNSLNEALRSRLSELESRDRSKEMQLLEQQRHLQDEKERHEAELDAVESKYKAQVEINLLLVGRILELHGILEAATSRRAGGASSAAINLASSASPRERSPPLSASLASSSEGSLAYIQSAGTPGIVMNEICDPGGEIPNLQAIVEPPRTQDFDESR